MNTPHKLALRILHLEDSELDAELLVRELRRGDLDFVIKRVETQPEFEEALLEFRPDIILADYKLPAFDGGTALKIAQERCPDIPVIIISGTIGEELTLELLKGGAVDMVMKERIRDRLVKAIQRAMDETWNKKVRRQVEEEREQLISELRHLASHDPLTGVTSRSAFMDILQMKTGTIDPKNPQGALFHININHFREMNTHYGTLVGDQILIETARRLNFLIGSGDVLGNFGGDKFYILIQRLNSGKELQDFLNRIRECFARPFPLRSFRIMVEVSIGAVVLNNPKTSPLELLLQMDEAMRLIKKGSLHGSCIVNGKIIALLQRRIELDQVMTEAIENKRMFLVYQPIIDTETGTIAGAEALLRCRKKDGSVLSAADFFESLERTKKLASVDEWIFAYFISYQLKVARPLIEQKGFYFSFNISPGILSTLDYGTLLLDQMTSSGMPPSSLGLEILESDLLLSNGDVAANLTLLRAAGVRIAVDDFGTGYSNLIRLATQPIDTVKIDKTYLEGIVRGDAKRNALLASLVGIARNLGYTIIAEGVEEKAQVDHLRTLGCHLMQGYLYGKPMSLEELLTLIGRPMTPIIMT